MGGFKEWVDGWMGGLQKLITDLDMRYGLKPKFYKDEVFKGGSMGLALL